MLWEVRQTFPRSKWEIDCAHLILAHFFPLFHREQRCAPPWCIEIYLMIESSLRRSEKRMKMKKSHTRADVCLLFSSWIYIKEWGGQQKNKERRKDVNECRRIKSFFRKSRLIYCWSSQKPAAAQEAQDTDMMTRAESERQTPQPVDERYIFIVEIADGTTRRMIFICVFLRLWTTASAVSGGSSHSIHFTRRMGKKRIIWENLSMQSWWMLEWKQRSKMLPKR